MLDDLEKDCLRYISAAPADRPPHLLQSLTTLVDLLLNAASRSGGDVKPSQSPSPSALGTAGGEHALALLEKAEHWCEVTEMLLRGQTSALLLTSAASPSSVATSPASAQDGRSPVDAGSQQASPSLSPAMVYSGSPLPYSLLTRVQATILKEKTLSLLRDSNAAMEQWGVAYRYARKVHKLDDVIGSVVHSVVNSDLQSDDVRTFSAAGGSVLSEVASLTDSDMLEFQRISSSFNPLRTAKNLMNLCVLVSKLKRHNEAAQFAQDSVYILRPLVQHERLGSAGTVHSMDKDDDIPDTNPSALLAAALYNLGSQLELCGRGQEAHAAFDEGLDVAEGSLGRKHPLTKQLRKILSNATELTASTTKLPSVASSMPQAYFVAGSNRATSRGGSPNSMMPIRKSKQEILGSNRGSSLMPMPPPPSTRATSLGAELRRVSTAPEHAARPPVSSRPPLPSRPVDDYSTRPLTHRGMRGTVQPLRADVIKTIPHGAALQPLRSQSSPSKAAWSGTTEEHEAMRHRKGVEPPVAVLDLSEALHEQQRERTTPTVDRLATATPVGAPPSAKATAVQSVEQHPIGATAAPPAVAADSADSTTKARGAAVPPPSREKEANVKAEPQARRSSKAGGGKSFQSIEAQREQQLTAWMKSITEKQFQEYSRRFRAALTIQCAWRCSRARLEKHNRMQVFFHFLYLEQMAAVRCITSAYQRHYNSKKLQRIKQRQKDQAKARVEEELRRDRAATVIAKAVRKYLAVRKRKKTLMRALRIRQEEKLVLYDTASVIVQRWFRIARLQKAYWRRRHAEIDAEKKRLAEVRRKDTAATLIQKLIRGVQGRAYARDYKKRRQEEQKELQRKLAESTDAVRIFLQEVRSRLHRLSMIPAAQERQRQLAMEKIKEGWSYSLQRRAMRHSCRRSRVLLLAAQRIQRFFRRYRARRDLRVLRTIQRTNSLIRIEKEFQQSRAALRIQCLVRIFAARRRVAQQKASRGRKLFLASIMLQRIGRALLERNRIGVEWRLSGELAAQAMAFAIQEKDRLVTVLQTFARAYLSRKKHHVLKDTEEREELLIARRARREMVEDSAAVKIQKTVRMHNAMDTARREREALDKHMAVVLAAVVSIQCLFRKAKARMVLKQKKVEALRAKRRRERDAEVAHEVFLMRAVELDALEDIERRHVEVLQDGCREAMRRDALHFHKVSAMPSADDEVSMPHDGHDDDDEESGHGIYDEM